MISTLLIATLVVLAVVVANRLAGYGTTLRAKWDEYSDRQDKQTAAKDRQPIPVTKRYLLVTTMFTVAALALWFWFHINEGDQLRKTFVGLVLFAGIALQPLIRAYKEYRKPGHGNRYSQRDNFEPDDDW